MKHKFIHLAKGLDIPFNVTTAKISFMGGNGSGKTYAATKIEEEILRAGGWLIVIDPVGIHYGLRLDATGKKPSGLDIPIFGGHHGDVILTPESGAMIADLLCDRRLSAVLDVSEFTDPEMNKFVTEFGIQFEKRMKAKHRAVTVALEECQEIIPQNPMKGEERKLHIWNRIAKIGRNYGIGVMMISARPQDINKKSLNLTQLMFAFQMTGTHERKAMEDWFTYSKYDAKIGDVLPSLEVGEPYVMSPRMLKINKQFKIFPKTTFDASATPDFFEDNSKTIALNPIDISALEDAMKKQIAEAKANDPKELHQEIARLKREIANRPTVEIPKPEIKEVQVPVITEEQIGEIITLIEDVNGTIQRLEENARVYSGIFTEPTTDLWKSVESLRDSLAQTRVINQHRVSVGVDRSNGKDRTAFVNVKQEAGKVVVLNGGAVTNPEQRVLDSLAWYKSTGQFTPEKKAIAAMAGYAFSGTFTEILGSLVKKGLIEYTVPKTASLTVAGNMVANHPNKSLTVQDVLSNVKDNISNPEWRVLEQVIDVYPGTITKQDIAMACGYKFSGTFTEILGDLKKKGLIDYPKPKFVKAAPFLFLE